MTEQSSYKTNRPLRVALLCGGISNERVISLRSAEGVKAALEGCGHTVMKIDTGGPQFINEVASLDIDVVFIALHGNGGEDGTVQGMLELMGIPYIGSGVAASALAMDKMRSKLLFEAAGLMTPPAAALTRRDLALLDDSHEPEGHFAESAQGQQAQDGLGAEDTPQEGFNKELIDTLIGEIGLPSVVKPMHDGSSFGVSIVRTREELCQALLQGFEKNSELLIEAFIHGTEVTVPIIGNDSPVVLPVIEIIPANEFYDFESKYAIGGSRHIIPARLAPEHLSTCEEAAYTAHEIIGCRGMSRTDIIVSEDGIAWVIEINTIPGMTATSLLPDSAQAAGISAAELYDQLLTWALEDTPLGAQTRPSVQDVI